MPSPSPPTASNPTAPDLPLSTALASLPPEVFESTYVHAVYNEIAEHFSDTRYKPWPAVHSFLSSQPAGSLGIDVGCGNGKYLGVNPSIVTIGCDRSEKLISICGARGFQAFVCDGLQVPVRGGAADFVISIAVIHHFATRERRLAAVKECLRLLNPSGKAFIQVWALEQQSKRSFTEQDNFVSWSLPTSKYKPDASESKGDVVYQRYYHLFKQGEIDELVAEAGGKIIESGYEKDNYYVICGW